MLLMSYRKIQEGRRQVGHQGSELPPTSMRLAQGTSPTVYFCAEGAETWPCRLECILRALSLHPCDFLVFANFFTFPHFSLKMFF